MVTTARILHVEKTINQREFEVKKIHIETAIASIELTVSYDLFYPKRSLPQLSSLPIGGCTYSEIGCAAWSCLKKPFPSKIRSLTAAFIRKDATEYLYFDS